MLARSRPRIATLTLGLLLAAAGTTSRGDDLPRRGFLGTAVAPLSAEQRREAGVEGDVGVIVREVLPDSAAREAGLEAGDVIVALNGEAVAGTADYVAAVRGLKAGAEVAVSYVRDGTRSDRPLTLTELPRERGEGYEVLHGAVESRGRRLRTIVTRPPGDGPFPAVFIIQGLGNGSVEQPLPGPFGAYRLLADHFSKRGFATLRVDKPGSGDSEGGPPQDTDFETEVDAYRQALTTFRDLDFVDEDAILIFGLSMGGVTGPIVAREIPVAGIATWGTASKTWVEYMLENSRRQSVLAGVPYPEIDRAMRDLAAMHHHVYREKMAPSAVAEAHPELSAIVAESYQDGAYLSGRHYGFFQQLADVDLAEVWAGYDGHALALWGEADFVATREDQELIAAIVNGRNPGRGEFRLIEDTDHMMNRAADFAESYAALASNAPGAFNPAFLDVVDAWADRVVRGR